MNQLYKQSREAWAEEHAEVERLRTINTEMLEALKAADEILTEHMDQLDWNSLDIWEKKRAVIAKAEGER